MRIKTYPRYYSLAQPWKLVGGLGPTSILGFFNYIWLHCLVIVGLPWLVAFERLQIHRLRVSSLVSQQWIALQWLQQSVGGAKWRLWSAKLFFDDDYSGGVGDDNDYHNYDDDHDHKYHHSTHYYHVIIYCWLHHSSCLESSYTSLFSLLCL